MQVKKIMTKNPACCTPDSTLQEVAHMMEMYDCGCIPVVDNHQTMRPLGTVTDRDITIRTFSRNKNPLEMKASDIMTTDIATVTPETDVAECMNVMEDKQIRRILVIDRSGRCTGIVAQADLAEHVTQQGETAEFIREVSENSRGENFKPNRSDNGGRDISERNYRSFSQNPPPPYLKHEKHLKRHKEPSFFSGKMLLTLLGSIGLGAGLKYYLSLEDEKRRSFPGRKVKDFDSAAIPVMNKKSDDSSINSTPFPAASSTNTTNREVISGSVNSFDKTDDGDLKPITEIGRAADKF